MHLKAVHMENFKSFGRKLTVPFEPGFTGITGPNGSGKSNIGDAILFVLGPNSARAIRAGRLTDLIFNGGEHGKPASHCVVTLDFDNEDRTMPVDADVVSLTRKIKHKPSKDNPDGASSYYYVNGRSSQKKEFTQLLNTARISADGYNITQQGDILQICKMSNSERRTILDNIAGVTAFDDDLRQAGKRRDDVDDNLERIGIILEELERNLKQLERERTAAQKVRDLKAQVQRTKGLMAYRRRRDVEEHIAQVQEQMERYTTERAGLEEKHKELKLKLKDLQATFAELEQEIREQGGEEVAKVQDDLEAARDRMVRLEEKMAFAKESLHDGSEDLAPLREELKRIEKELARTEKMRVDCEQEHATAAADLERKRKDLEDARDLIAKSDEGSMAVNRELAKLKQEHEATQIRLHDTRLEVDRLREKITSGEARLAETADDLESSKTNLAEVQQRLDEAAEMEKGSGKKRKEQEKRLFALRKQEAELAAQVEDLASRIRRMVREKGELQAKQEAAHGIAAASQAVKTLLAARDRGEIQGIVGTIAELATVDDEHQQALQTAAGGRMYAVVVDDDAVGAQCIELLKRNRAGRATVLPLNKMAPGRPRGQALMKSQKEGSLGFALDLVTFNERYRNAFWYVFGDTIVARNMNAGRGLMGGVRIVTLDGELFEASGAMTGGQQAKKQAGAFSSGDRGRIDELLVKIKQSEDAEEEALERLSAAKRELRELEDELRSDHQDGALSEHHKQELEKKRDQYAGRVKDLGNRLEESEKALAAMRGDLEKAEQAIEAGDGRLAELAKHRDEKGQLLLKGTKKELRDKVQELEKAVTGLHEKVTETQGRMTVAGKQAELVAARRKEVEKQIEALGGDRERYEDDLKRYQEAHKKAKTEVEALLKMERKLTGNLRGLQDKKDQVYQDTVKLEAQIEKVQDRMETHFGLITNAKAKLPTLEETLADALVELQEYPVEVEEGEEVPAYDDLRRELRNLEQRIERMGPVNERALEDFDEQDKRRQDLVAEVDRLKEQRAELEKLVEEISKKKKLEFMEVYDAVNENFAQVYAKLSLGGKALMELENPDDPFAGGLILKAQPLGKRVTRLDALSGGEKSLTSMAFIFAIQQYDPSPFYYLDEVDQNLDAVNSELLAQMVKENSKFAQFIQVSLRKITLKEAAHVYGVTQQVAGQSDIIANFDIGQIRDTTEKPDHIDEESGPDDGDEEQTLEKTFDGMVQVKVTE